MAQPGTATEDTAVRDTRALDLAAENKALFRRFVDCWNSGDTEGMMRCWSPDLVHHGRGGAMDREAVQALMGGFMEAFAGLHFEVEQLVAEGDLVAARMVATATHQRDFMGLPATGRRIRVIVMGQVRMRDGRIVEHWNVMDELHFMQQLGLASAGLLDPVPS